MTSGAIDMAQARSAVDDLVSNGTLPAAALLVQHEGSAVIEYATGKARLSPEVPASTNTVWRIASISKPIAAVGLLKLVDAGKLSLDTPVAEVLPEFTRPRVLVRHIVTHTSGVPDDAPPFDEILRLGIVRAVAAQPLKFEPGTACEYSTVTFELLKEIVVRLSGKRWAEYMRDEVFAPVGMNATTYDYQSEWGNRLAVAYDPAGGQDNWANDPVLWGWQLAGGGLSSTLYDLARFGQVMCDGGSPLISPQSYAEMTRLQTAGLMSSGGELVTWGLGWYLNRDGRPNGFGRYMSERAFGHGGATTTRLSIDPENKVVLAFMANRVDLTAELSQLVQAGVTDAVMADLGLTRHSRC